MRLKVPLLHRHHALSGSLSGFATAIFFFSVFNGIVGYVVPLSMDSRGFSESVLGLLYASSAVAGAMFDLIMGRLLRSTHYRRMFLVTFALAALFTCVLWGATNVMMFVIAMVLWGLYFDFYMFGRFDFVGRLPHRYHASAWGVMNAALSAGLVASPLIADFFISTTIGSNLYIIAIMFLAISASVFFWTQGGFRRAVNAGNEVRIIASRFGTDMWNSWKLVGRKLYPVLTFTLFLNMLDSFFWVIGPLLAHSLDGLNSYEGLFLSLYSLPALFIGRLLRSGSRRFGKKRLAFACCVCGSLVLTLFLVSTNVWVMLAVVLIASSFFNIAWPSINGAYADYIQESPGLEKTIEAMEDLSSNAGYIFGPILAGLFAGLMGSQNAFVGIGVIGIVVGLILFVFTPRTIRLHSIQSSVRD